MNLSQTAIFSHQGKTEKNTYSIGFPFTEVMNFTFQKLELGSTDWRAYIQQDNPIAAALLSVMGYKTKETYLQLDPKEEIELKKDLEQLDVHEAKAFYELETSWERRGKIEGKIEMIIAMYKESMPLDTITKVSGLTREEIQKIMESRT